MVITLAACRRTLSSKQRRKSEAADRGAGIMGRELPEWKSTAQSHCSFPRKFDFYTDMMEVIVPQHTEMSWGEMHPLKNVEC